MIGFLGVFVGMIMGSLWLLGKDKYLKKKDGRISVLLIGVGGIFWLLGAVFGGMHG
jgi:hypothetical protein